MELQDSAAFENSPSETHIRFRWRRVTGGVIVHHDEGVGGQNNRRLKYFARMRERLVDTALADGGDLDQLLLYNSKGRRGVIHDPESASRNRARQLPRDRRW
jgi:hypothetical protein